MVNYRGVSLPEELIKRVQHLIRQLRTYTTVAEFIREAVRLRVETLEKEELKEEGYA